MAIQTSSTSFSNIVLENRFEPNYWIKAQKILNVLNRYRHENLLMFCQNIKKGIFDLKAERYQTEGVPFLRISNLKYFELGEADLVYISSFDNNVNSKTILKHKDIAMSKIGSLGQLYRVGKKHPMVNISQNLIGIIFKQDAPQNYIFSVLLSKFALYQLHKNKKQQLQDKLNLDDVKYLQIPLLPESVINQIDCSVTKIEELTEAASEKIVLAQSLFYKSLSIDFSAIVKEKYFSARLSDFVDEDLWTPKYSYPLFVNSQNAIASKHETLRLGDIVEKITKGDEVGSDAYIGYLDKRETDVPFIRTTDLVNYETDLYPDFFIPQEIYKELNQDLKAGDILFTKDGKIGVCAMITSSDKVIVSSGIARLRLNSKWRDLGLTQEYLFVCLMCKEIAQYQAKQRTVVASTIPHLREERLSEFQIPKLPQSVIDEITALVKQAFEIKAEKKRLLAEVRKEMDDYFDLSNEENHYAMKGLDKDQDSDCQSCGSNCGGKLIDRAEWTFENGVHEFSFMKDCICDKCGRKFKLYYPDGIRICKKCGQTFTLCPNCDSGYHDFTANTGECMPMRGGRLATFQDVVEEELSRQMEELGKESERN